MSPNSHSPVLRGARPCGRDKGGQRREQVTTPRSVNRNLRAPRPLLGAAQQLPLRHPGAGRSFPLPRNRSRSVLHSRALAKAEGRGKTSRGNRRNSGTSTSGTMGGSACPTSTAPLSLGDSVLPLGRLLTAQRKDLGTCGSSGRLPSGYGGRGQHQSPPAPRCTGSSPWDQGCRVPKAVSRPCSAPPQPSFRTGKSACEGVVPKKPVEFKHKWSHSVFTLNCHLPMPREFRIQRSFQASTFRTGRQRHPQRRFAVEWAVTLCENSHCRSSSAAPSEGPRKKLREQLPLRSKGRQSKNMRFKIILITWPNVVIYFTWRFHSLLGI